ncbi:hypothetical protein IV203_029795 [Nitzschia inconspicua]|uniref:Uncharacterized protein n=1 Tax=Nitzschia inconspicua TaxID=303405 RepID=A0A9K3LSC6_9STRA|nr:hypothetical protein IV203_029795 [Nitzschia inconspicua]
MTKLLQWCSIIAALASLSCPTFSLDSINLDLEVLEEIDLSPLGTPDLSRFEAMYNVSVDPTTCQYEIKLSWKKHAEDTPGEPMFQGSCAPEDNTGNAGDGLPWHEQRRHWVQFPRYVFDATGFDHLSMSFLPCGRNPGLYKQARYDLNFFTVIPQYRTFMRCETFKTPKICQYNQTEFIGRGFFSIPRLVRDPNFLANMPNRFQPDPEHPEGFEHEGLTHYDPTRVTDNPDEWVLPDFLMSTYDGDVISWRLMFPYNFISGDASSVAGGDSWYVYQTMPRLPTQWNMTYDANSQQIDVYVYGPAGMCGQSFDAAKAEQEIPIFEDPLAGGGGAGDNGINRLRA